MLHGVVQAEQVAGQCRIFEQGRGEFRLMIRAADVLGQIRQECLREPERLECVCAVTFGHAVVDFAGRHQGDTPGAEQDGLALEALALHAGGDQPDMEIQVEMPLETELREATRAQHQAGHVGDLLVLDRIGHGKGAAAR